MSSDPGKNLFFHFFLCKWNTFVLAFSPGKQLVVVVWCSQVGKISWQIFQWFLANIQISTLLYSFFHCQMPLLTFAIHDINTGEFLPKVWYCIITEWARLGRDHSKSFSLTFLLKLGHHRAHWTGFSFVLFSSWILPMRETPQPLCVDCSNMQWLTKGRSSSSHLGGIWGRTVHHFLPVASCPISWHHQADPGSNLLTPSLQILLECDDIPSKSSVL